MVRRLIWLTCGCEQIGADFGGTSGAGGLVADFIMAELAQIKLGTRGISVKGSKNRRNRVPSVSPESIRKIGRN